MNVMTIGGGSDGFYGNHSSPYAPGGNGGCGGGLAIGYLIVPDGNFTIFVGAPTTSDQPYGATSSFTYINSDVIINPVVLSVISTGGSNIPGTASVNSNVMYQQPIVVDGQFGGAGGNSNNTYNENAQNGGAANIINPAYNLGNIILYCGNGGGGGASYNYNGKTNGGSGGNGGNGGSGTEVANSQGTLYAGAGGGGGGGLGEPGANGIVDDPTSGSGGDAGLIFNYGTNDFPSIVAFGNGGGGAATESTNTPKNKPGKGSPGCVIITFQNFQTFK